MLHREERCEGILADDREMCALGLKTFRLVAWSQRFSVFGDDHVRGASRRQSGSSTCCNGRHRKGGLLRRKPYPIGLRRKRVDSDKEPVSVDAWILLIPWRAGA